MGFWNGGGVGGGGGGGGGVNVSPHDCTKLTVDVPVLWSERVSH